MSFPPLRNFHLHLTKNPFAGRPPHLCGVALKIALDGAAKGVAVQYLATLAASICLHLGYFMPYPAFLPEAVGGELQAVVWMAVLSALLGAGVALAFSGAAHVGRKPAQPHPAQHAHAHQRPHPQHEKGTPPSRMR